MVGPGTGVAPFRAFLEEREETGAAGKTWLFFGDRRFRTDFLYQTDWLRWLKRGVLTRMDVAFSRDPARKCTCSIACWSRAAICTHGWRKGPRSTSAATPSTMAPDVRATLETIVQREGGKRPEEAAAYLAEMQQQGRYHRDVY